MPVDPTVMLLIGAETGVLDDSSYARPLTPVGNAARTTAQFKYGVASLTFDGTGDRVTAPLSADLGFGAGNFTVEGWFRFVTKTDNQALLGWWGLGVASASWFLWISGGSLMFRGCVGAVTQDVSVAWVPTLGQWYHLAVDRSGSTVRVYRDGVVVATNAAYTYTLNLGADPFSIGAVGDNNNFPIADFNGQMDEVRVTKGLARYAGAFTPPTGPFPRPGDPPSGGGPGGATKAKLGNKHGRTDENGAIIVAVGTTPGTPGVIGPLTVFPHLCGEVTDTGLQVASVTAGALRTKLTPLGNLRVTTDDQGSLRVAAVTAGAIGPLTDLGNLQCRTDETGALIVASVGAGSLVSAPSPLLNLRGRTDDQGALVVTGLSNPLAYQQRILADGAAAYWPLNDAVGSTSAVDLAGPRNAVISGAVTLAQSGGPGTSQVMLFGSAKTGMLAPPSLPVYGLAFTVELWMKPTLTPSSNSGLVYRTVIADGDFQFYYRITTGDFLFQLYQSSLQTRLFPFALTLNAWLYVVLVCTGTQVQLYLNTVAQGLQSLLTGSNGLGAVALGNMADGPTNGFVGAMGDVAFYQKVLAASDINAHYALRTAP